MGKRGNGIREGGTGERGILRYTVGWSKRGGGRRVGAIARRGERAWVVVEQVVGGMVRHVHGFCVIEVLRGDRLGEMVVRRRSGVHGLERREGLIEIRGVETVRGLVCGGRAKVHCMKGREGGRGGGGGDDGSGQRRDLKLFARMGDEEQMGDRGRALPLSHQGTTILSDQVDRRK